MSIPKFAAKIRREDLKTTIFKKNGTAGYKTNNSVYPL
jgi:hypothetical protein